MIIKEATGRDDDIHEIQRLADLNPHIRMTAETEIRNIRSGLSGEGSAAHFLNREFRDSKRVAVLHDIRIDCADGDYAQIDHLLIHRIQGTAWILETKNYSGDLSCDEHGDWVVFYNRHPTPVSSPIEQAKRQVIALERWLKKRDIKGINRVIPVVLTNPKARISRKHLRPDDHVVKSDNFARWYQDESAKIGAGTALAMMGRFLVSGMDEMQLRLVGRKICDAHEPAHFNWAARLGVAKIHNGSSQLAAVVSSTRKTASHDQERTKSVQVAISPLSDPPPTNLIETSLGVIRTQTLDDGRIALRHDHNEQLSAALSAACKGRGQWNPRYHNWIVRAADLPSIIARM